MTTALTAEDYRSLEARWITPELADAAKLERVDAATGREIVGQRHGDFAGIAIPYFLPGETAIREYRIRRDNPDLEAGSDGKIKERKKYVSPPGRGNLLYFPPPMPPELLSKVDIPVVLTEGEFKALALWRLSIHASETPRFLPVGLGGVWNWRGTVAKAAGRNGGRCDVKGVIPDFDLISWAVRRVIIAFDADSRGDESVMAARNGLARELRRRGAKVAFLEWDPTLGKGIDDHLGRVGPEKVLEEIDAAWKVQDKAKDEPAGILLSEVKPGKVEWLWENRMPQGKLTMLDGDPDLGKSLLTLEIAARVSKGEPLPGNGVGVSGGVVILTAEDGLADTVVLRLIAAGADRGRIVALPYAPEYASQKTVSNIPVDIPTIMEAIERVGAKLVIVDVLMAYLPGQINTYRDQDVRLALAPLAQLAARTGVAVICIRHLTKAPGGNPLYRGGGSIGIIGAARAGLLVARDPDNPDLMVLARNKGNLGKPWSSLSYRIAETEILDESGKRIKTPRIEWVGESHQTADSLLAATAGDEEERGALAEAKDFLREELAKGRQPQKELKAAARKGGIKDATLRRAKVALGVKSGKDGFESEWHWELPNIPKSAEDAHIHGMSTFGGNRGSETVSRAE